MSSDKLYSLAEIVRRTGAKRRAVQLWADGGVLHALPETDRSGTGVHRMFTFDELQIAALLVPLASIGTPIGMLRRLADRLRDAFYLTHPGAVIALTQSLPKGMGPALVNAAAKHGVNYMLFKRTPDSFSLDVRTAPDGASVNIDPVEVFGADQKEVMAILDLNALLAPLCE